MKIPVMELSDHEGNLDSLKLCDALAKGQFTLYGMDMETIKHLRYDYLNRHGHLPPGPELRQEET